MSLLAIRWKEPQRRMSVGPMLARVPVTVLVLQARFLPQRRSLRGEW